MSKLTSYRWCFVPLCKNTTNSAPSKVFVTFPRVEATRKLWFRLARRPDEPTKSNYFYCGDHFVVSIFNIKLLLLLLSIFLKF